MSTLTHIVTVVALRAVLALLLVPGLGAAQDTARMQELIRARVDDGTFMGTVLVARGDEVLLSEGYGSANLEWNIKNAPSTKFRLGSITKQFTAAAILKLAEQGKLAVDDTVKTHWSGAPAAWDAITIRHLLTHTSGVPNLTSFPDMQTWKLQQSTPLKTIGYFRDKPLDFAPGERMSYSNSGYIVLGYLVERVSGQDYAQFLRDSIFEPLGMKDTGYDLHATILPNRASGYTMTTSGLRNAPYIDMTVPFGAGALYSTTEDLLRWTQGLFGGRVLSAASLEAMTTPPLNNYAFGVSALVIYTSAFVCEALRSGINAVPVGQAEAARAIGLTFTQSLGQVVLPQAFRTSIPPLGSVIIAMFKNSAVVGAFGVGRDLSKMGCLPSPRSG